MTTRSRTLLVIATLLLALAFVLPLWRVSLEAPQYPGGIGMQIHINTITGVSKHDLQNINGLNHYIGMQKIVPESIPELRIMPWLFGIMIGLGFLAAALARRWMLYLWTGLLCLLLAIGFVDYYKWGYDYGHNLSPDAAIKIPGMAYQPPLIGSKEMLNFVAHSWPDTGGLAVFVALALAIVATFLELRRRRGRAREVAEEASKPNRKLAVAGVALLALFAACEPAPEPLAVGEMACSHCRMEISDARFGAELVSTTGKVYPFDAVECLSAYLADESEASATVHSLWVAAFDKPGTLLPVDEAFFLRSEAVQSPMGGGLAAYSSAEALDAARAETGGATLDWADVLALGASEDSTIHATHGH